MNRLRVAGVYIVNWLGYPASQWHFDGPVVQFHGENGAGKTTAMAAIVAALVPSASRVDSIFRGNTPAHAGLRTKIGANGNPSYSVLRLEADGASPFYVGVRLMANPAVGVGVSITPFVAHDFPIPPDPEAWLVHQDGDVRRIATLDEIRDAAGRAGGKFRHFSGPGDYYGFLHQLGILPRPLKDREDQDQFAKLYLAGFGGDAAQLVYRLKDHFLPEQEQLGNNLQTMDEVYRRLIRGRADIDAYESKRLVLERLWKAANDLVRCAWANDEFRHQYARQEAADAQTDIERAERDETRYKTDIDAFRADEPQLKVRAQEAERLGAESRDAVGRQIASLERTTERRRRVDAHRAALPGLTQLTDIPVNNWQSFIAAREEIRARRDISFEVIADLRKTLANLDRDISALGEGREALEAAALARQPHVADLDIEAARRLQATLGPAVDAIVSQDPEKAGRAALHDPSAPTHSWFIREEELEHFAEPFVQNDEGALVREGPFLRASKLPGRPILGIAARERTMRDLKRDRVRTAAELDASQRTAGAIESILEQGLGSLSDSADLFPDEMLPSETVLQTRLGNLRSLLSDPKADDKVMRLDDEDRLVVAAWREATSVAVATAAAVSRSSAEIARYEERLRQAITRVAKAREAGRTAQASLSVRAASRNAWFDLANGEPLLSTLSESSWLETLRPDFAADNLAKLAAGAGQILREQAGDPVIAMTLAPAGAGTASDIDQACIDQTAENCLRVWRMMRDVAFSLTPRNLTSTNDPVEACAALSARVAELRIDVEKAEGLFRVEAGAIRRAIENAISRQRRRIDALNSGSVDARFGDLSGIRLKLSSKIEMLDLLDSHLTEVERLSADMSFSEALEAVARLTERAQRRAFAPNVSQLTDYRNYAELGVEVRHCGSEAWRSIEEEDPSTGERIGIAFVCLLLVLEAWETRSLGKSLLPGTCLRFLVIDEAARLDSRGLASIAAFAQAADAQVLVAAPQEQPIPGSSTTYTFVRTRDPGGAPRVVTRRRVLVAERYDD